MRCSHIDILDYLKEADLEFIVTPQPCPVCKKVEVYGNYWCDNCRFNICVNCKEKPIEKNNLYVARCEDCNTTCYACGRELKPDATKIHCDVCLGDVLEWCYELDEIVKISDKSGRDDFRGYNAGAGEDSVSGSDKFRFYVDMKALK